MGYRSEVAFIAAFKDDETLANFITHRRLTNWKYNEWAGLGTEQFTIEWAVDEVRGGEQKWRYQRPPFLIFSADYVKWYEGYNDVEWIEGVFDEAVKDWGAGAVFFRIGEDTNDIQDSEFARDDEAGHLIGSIWDNFGIHRSISMDVEGEPIKKQMKQLGENYETK